MSKKVIIILTSAIFVLGLSAGGVYFLLAGKAEGGEKEKNQQFQRGGLENNFQERDDLITADIGDLTIGENVIVRGVVNSDGSITSQTIYIGMEEGNFPPGLSEGFRQGTSSQEGGPTIQLRMEEFFGEGNFPPMEGGRTPRGQASTGFVRGEIINKDELSISVKLPEGGSKLVFYSEETEIFKFSEEIQY